MCQSQGQRPGEKWAVRVSRYLHNPLPARRHNAASGEARVLGIAGSCPLPTGYRQQIGMYLYKDNFY